MDHQTLCVDLEDDQIPYVGEVPHWIPYDVLEDHQIPCLGLEVLCVPCEVQVVHHTPPGCQIPHGRTGQGGPLAVVGCEQGEGVVGEACHGPGGQEAADWHPEA